MKKLFFLIIVILYVVNVSAQDNKIESTGDVGIGTKTPITKLHVRKAKYGTKTQNAIGMFEGLDCQLDLISSSDASWGSSLNLVEGNGTSNTDVWSIIRQTTNGQGNSSLNFNFGANNHHLNPTKLTILKNGNIGVGTVTPITKLHVRKAKYGTKTQHAIGMFEGLDCQLDLISSSDATWGSSLNLVEGNGTSNTDVWSIVRQTTNGQGNSSLNFNFGTYNHHLNSTKLTILNNGNVGIGKNPDSSTKLDVAGTIRAEEIRVEANGQTADFVFAEDYNLKDLSEVETFIKNNKHLPDIPSAEEMEEEGVNLAEMNKLLLQKIEELTLHTIAQEKKLREKGKDVKELKEARKKEQGEREKLEEEVTSMKYELQLIKDLFLNNQNNAR